VFQLTSYFQGVSTKTLSAVETQRHTSNQHEFNGTSAMKRYLGSDRREIKSRFIYIGSDDDVRLSLDSTVTWYDARKQHPIRSEHRLYFKNNDVMTRAEEGDVLITALGTDGVMLLIIVSIDCSIINQVLWLFDVSELPGTSFTTVDPARCENRPLAIFSYIAEEAGIDLPEPKAEGWLDILLDRFGPRFPTTHDFSALALETLGSDIDPVEAPDDALMCLMDREEALFRELETHIVAGYLSEHAASWSEDVDAFVKFSLGVHNRRKSRAGHAFENHLEWIFDKNSLRFKRGARTENRSKPDFLYPGEEQYADKSFPAEYLTMLGVKTSCKDRWRQVLNEAHRIPNKHLLTLQPAISEHQITEMEQARLTLVLPTALHSSYNDKQRSRLLCLQDFISLVSNRQSQWMY